MILGLDSDVQVTSRVKPSEALLTAVLTLDSQEKQGDLQVRPFIFARRPVGSVNVRNWDITPTIQSSWPFLFWSHWQL